MRAATAFSQNERLSLSYLIIYGIVAFTKYSLYPWILIYLHYRTSLSSWGQVVLGYGLLLTTLYFGEHIGRTVVQSYVSRLSNAFYTAFFLLLTVSYIAIAFVSRFLILVALFWIVGFTGAMLDSFTLNIDKRLPLLQFQKRQLRGDSYDPNRTIERSIICFVFFTLLTAFLYDHRPHVEFPCYYLSLLLVLSCLTMLLYYFILQRTISGKKSALSARLTSASSASYQHLSSSASSASSSSGGAGLSPATSSTEVELSESDLRYSGDVPLNFLNACSGDISKARQMYGKMLAWRRQYNLDAIFDTPQHGFDNIATYYPHAIHGYSKDGCGVVYEILGKGRAKELTDCGVSIDDIVWHFNLRNEVVFRHLLAPERVQEAMRKAPKGAIEVAAFASPYSDHPHVMRDKDKDNQKASIPRLMTVIDLKGISMSSFSLHVISFLKKSSDTIDQFYPEQVARLVVCNAPSWFSLIWGTIKKVLPEAVQNKVDISYDCTSLDRFIDKSQRPKEYGGTDPTPLGQSESHLFFLSLAEKWKQKIKAEQSLQTEAGGDVRREQGSAGGSAGNSNSNSNGNGNGGGKDQGKGRGGGSVLSWFSDRFKKVPSAYLGEKNTYKFNEETGKWEMEVEEEREEETLTLLRANQHHYSSHTTYSHHSDDSAASSDEEEKRRSLKQAAASGGPPSALKRADSLDFAMAKARARAKSISSSDKINNHSNHQTNHTSSTTSHTPYAMPAPISISSTASNHTSSPSTAASSSSQRGRRGGGSAKTGNKMSKEQLEEHGLVLAIHAAHFASKLAKTRSSAHALDPANAHLPLSVSSNQVLSRSESGVITANLAINDMELGIGRSEPVINDQRYRHNHSNHHSNDNENEDMDGEMEMDMEDDASASLLGGSSSSHSSASATSSSSSSYTSSKRSGSRARSRSSSASSSSSSSYSSGGKAKISGKIFLLVSFIFIVVHVIQSLVWTLLPVFFSSPLRSGGLGYNVRDLGLLLSSAGLITLQLHAMLGSRADFLLRASPVRALRIGCGVFFVCAFALQLYVRWCTMPIEEALHHLHPLTTASASQHVANHHLHQGGGGSNAVIGMMSHSLSSIAASSDHLLMLSGDHHHSSLLRSFPTTIETETRILAYLSHVLPSLSALALLLPSLLLALLVSSLHLCRKAAGILFHLALASSFQHPLIIRSTLNTIAEVVGPLCASLLYSLIYSTRLRFPLDSSFFLSFSASLILIAYMLSLFLTIHFRGDYGIMTDEDVTHYNHHTGGGRGTELRAGDSGNKGLGALHQRHASHSSTSTSPSSPSHSPYANPSFAQNGAAGGGGLFSALTDHVLSVPLSDVSLLLSSSGSSYSYGSKLHNLKDDFKDV